MNLSWQLMLKMPQDLFLMLINHPKMSVAAYMDDKKTNKYLGTT